jgi:hypothetical protein
MLKRAIGLGLLISTVAGCGGNSDWMLRRPPETQSTLGNDFSNAPAGKVIRPPGLGVDLGARVPGPPSAIWI